MTFTLVVRFHVFRERISVSFPLKMFLFSFADPQHGQQDQGTEKSPEFFRKLDGTLFYLSMIHYFLKDLHNCDFISTKLEMSDKSSFRGDLNSIYFSANSEIIVLLSSRPLFALWPPQSQECQPATQGYKFSNPAQACPLILNCQLSIYTQGCCSSLEIT